MRRSEIFDEFVKIAEENNLVSSEKSFSKLEKNPRADSLSISDIEKLYNVKPDSTLKYKNNIIESAHPDSSVVSNAYDKLNGLVENNIERQNILLNIVNKNNNGHLTQHKYAEKELLLSLVKIANDLDNKNQDELRCLADVCIEQVSSKSIKKEAQAAAAGLLATIGPWAAAVGLIAGAMLLKSNLPKFNSGFKPNHEDLMKQLDDLINSNDVTLGFGRKLRPEFIETVKKFKSLISRFYTLYTSLAPAISRISEPKTKDEKIQLAKAVVDKKDSNTQKGIEHYNKLKKLMENMQPYFQTVKDNFNNDIYKELQTEESGFFTGISDMLGIDDFNDVRRAIAPYEKSLKELQNYMDNSIKAEQAESERAVAELQASPEVTDADIDNLGQENPGKVQQVSTTSAPNPTSTTSNPPI